ncbi:MAG: pyruvate:ferredoxin (flavodoxin) oxidoreductase [Candidatus Nanoarchaeia archaeon]|nr:pyruvate:ferredoxin (flavodoxin) oxidoreductase [Candidatus Nanoarchaeia archaeon]
MVSKKDLKVIDGNTAASYVAYALSDVAAIYPITPASTMGELVDEWSSQDKKNIFGEKVSVVEMQSEAGAAGAVHGSLVAGSLTTTFTASQGLLLMMPNMFKIAGELLSGVFHVAARSLACQSLSIFGDHSDVMAVRGTGFGMINSSSVQEVLDFAIIAHLTSIETRIPMLHFFDGFRTSHEIQKIHMPGYDEIKSMVDMNKVKEFRSRALSPEHPVCKVGAQNPDVYFQGRETVNPYYKKLPFVVKKYMKLIKNKFGRSYDLFEYVGNKNADRIIISMGSSCETIEETINYLNKKGYKVGLIKVRLYRPFFDEEFLKKIPKSVKKIAVLDRTKEPGSGGEPLYLDVSRVLKNKNIKIIGGRYGLSSKEFTPAMVKAVYDHLNGKCFNDFTVGINDDVTNKSLKIGEEFDSEPSGIIRARFFGVGSDGTIGANKNTVKIIGEETELNVQAYLEYDAKQSGGVTISHLRFGKNRIQSTYKPTRVDFIALHHRAYIGRYDILKGINEHGIFLINSPWSEENLFENLTEDMQRVIINKKIKVYNIDATKIAKEAGLENKINTTMQAAFVVALGCNLKYSKIINPKRAIELVKEHIKETYKSKGQDVVNKNLLCVDKAMKALQEIKIPNKIVKSKVKINSIKCETEFDKKIFCKICKLEGNDIPVSLMPVDGSIPTGTTKLEKKGIANFVPSWNNENCIQCGQCSFVCPHSAIRVKQIDPKDLKNKPKTFKTIKSNTNNNKNLQYRVQVYPEDCVGCMNCVLVCPGKGKDRKALSVTTIDKSRENNEVENSVFFENLPDDVLDGVLEFSPVSAQFHKQMFEFPGSCTGCGETPYIRLVTQLFGDRMLIANATGCSSIYGGTFPVVPYTKNKEGKGPAWANSLFEDNAEYGFGMKLAVDANRKQLLTNIEGLLKIKSIPELDKLLKERIKDWDKIDENTKKNAESIKKILPLALKKSNNKNKNYIEKIDELKDFLIDKSVWIIGGDGWAYDIGFGGLDHVLAQGKDVNILVLDTEVYSNTGGQASKATPLGAIAKFASSGKKIGKKDLGLMMTIYGNVYVAMVNMGADKVQLIKAVLEAEKYKGPSLIIAYCPCIAHGIDMSKAQEIEKMATDSGYWPLFRYNPELLKQGKNPFILDKITPKIPFRDYLMTNKRFSSLKIINPKEAELLFKQAEMNAMDRIKRIKAIASGFECHEDTNGKCNVKLKDN